MLIRERPTVVLYATFVLTGVLTTLLGPALPVLVTWWGLDDGRAGLLFAAQFVGSMMGSALSSVGMTRLGFRSTLVAGVALMAVGVGALGLGAHALGMIAIFSYGVGLGLTIPTTNLYVAQVSGATRASALNVLNLAWGIGAVATPPVVALFQRTDNTRTFLFALAAALLLMAVPLARIVEPGDSGVQPAPERITPGHAIRSTGGTLTFGVLLFLYVGTETSVAGWVALYARRLEVVPATLSLAIPSVFWAALLAGRAAAPAVLRRIPESRLLGAGLLVATVGVSALLVARSAGVLAVAVAIGGLGLSTIFPLTVARFTRDLDRAAARAAGPIFVLAGFGGATLPPLVGFISTQFGSLTAGLFVPLFGCLAMGVALSRIRARAPAGVNWEQR
jgi:FHS family glucose/mannose:H+ symporter-like MFS transporter